MFTRPQGDLAKGFEFEARPRHACNLVVHETKNRFLGRHRAVVQDIDRDLDDVCLRHESWRDFEIGQNKVAVSQAVTEGKERRRPNVEISAGEAIVRIGRPTRHPFAEEDRDLPNGARPCDRRAAARGDGAGDHIGDRMARLAARKPRRQHRIGALDQPRHDQGAAGKEDDDDRLSIR